MELISLFPLWWLIVIPILIFGFQFSLVDAPFWKRLTSFLLRTAGILFLVLALCRPFSFLRNDDLHVVFVIDASQSIDLPGARDAVSDIETAMGNLQSNDSWSFYLVGKGVKKFETIDALKSLLDEWIDVAPDDNFRSASLLADGLLHSRLSFPSESSKRIVLFSDGQNTDGELANAMKQLEEEEIDVRFNKLASLSKAEASVVSLRPSSKTAFHNEVLRMTTTLSSNQNVSGKLRMIHRGVAVQEQEVKLSANQETPFYFDVDMVTPGASRWTAEFIPDNDYFLINNQRSCTVTVRGKPRILILHQKEPEMRSFVRAMEEQDFVVEVRGKFGLPETMSELIAFDAIVFADMPATFLSQRQMTLLNQYVKDFGGGLAMLGSENSFGLGGYHKTPVEEVLPLVSRFEKEKEKPSLAMVLVVDKSGSMDGLPMELARQASKAAADLLGPRDQIGVIGFDSEAYVVSEMRSAAETDAIQSGIDSLTAGGGTNMFPAMVIGKDMLENTSAKIRHMICLSDGQTQEADHEALTQEMTANGITVSTVALGDADKYLMSQIAEIGRGRYYETDDPSNVPQIFTKETMQASKSAIKEDLFGSVPTGDHPVMSGFREADLPFSLGYVMTQSKPTAQMLLITETGDPLLAISRFGLGTGLAYTSDLSEKWGGEWLAWGDCGKFWGQILRGIVRKNDSDGIQIASAVNQGKWELRIKRTDSTGSPQPNVPWNIATLDEQGETTAVEFSETGLGTYRVSVPIADQSNLTLRIQDPTDNKLKVLHYDRPYPAEYRLSNTLPEQFKSILPVASTGIREDVTPKSTRQSIVYLFYMLALICFLVGNLFRRI